jgi:hypothetical protein
MPPTTVGNSVCCAGREMSAETWLLYVHDNDSAQQSVSWVLAGM